MPLAELFSASFGTRRREIGLEWRGTALTFGDVDDRATRMARALAARGLVAGDRLAVYLSNGLELVDVYLACVRTGVVFVPINVLYREREIDHILSDAQPRAIVAAGALPATVPADVWRVETLAAEASVQATTPVSPSARIGRDTPAALIYTSGTTGLAKGAILTHGNFAANGATLVDAWRFTAEDRLLLALPLFHVHGLGNGLHCWLGSGARLRLLERFEAATAAAEFESFAPTVFFGVPTMYVRLLDWPADLAARVGRVARLFVSGSAPLPASVFEEFRSRFGHAILERYGMTETLMTIGNPYDGERRPGTVGRPFPGVTIKVLDDAGEPVKPGATGELHVSGPTVCAGYWNRPDADAKAFANGFFRTGDLATISDDGYVTLCGRRSDLIISGGFNIYPREIEEVLLEHPAVAEAAVASAPDPARGEVPVAYVVIRPGAEVTTRDLQAHCREKLASFKTPRTVQVVDRLPRTALGKVQKHMLPAGGGKA